MTQEELDELNIENVAIKAEIERLDEAKQEVLKRQQSLFHRSWKMRGGLQVGETVVESRTGKTGIIENSYFSDWSTPKNCEPRLEIRLFKKDGSLGERVTTVYFASEWKKV